MADRSNMHWTHCYPAPIVRVNRRLAMTTPGNELLEQTRQGSERLSVRNRRTHGSMQLQHRGR